VTAPAGRRLVRLTLPLACLGAALPVIVSTIHALSERWIPYGDQAVIASQAYDVFSSHTPLLGQYSASYHLVSQPTYSLGPMLYWLLALPARIGQPDSLTIWMGALNIAAIAGVVVLARRRGGTAFMLATAVAVALMCRSLVPETYHDIWNPSAAVLPLTLLMFVCWSLACGEYRLLPLAVLLASFVVQCHLTYVAPALGLLTVGLAGLVLARRWTPPRDGATLRRWAVAAILIGLVSWSAPVVQQLTKTPGNLGLVAQLGTKGGGKLGWDVGWHAVVKSVGVPPWWLTVPADQFERSQTVKPAPSALATAAAVAVLLGLAAVALAGLRRRRLDLAGGAVLALALCAAVEVVTARTPAKPHLEATLGYTLWWASPAGMFAWLVLGWSAVVLLRSRLALPALRLRRLAPAFGVAAALAVGAAVGAAEKADDHASMYRAIRTTANRLRAALPRGSVVSLEGSPGLTSVVRVALRYDLRLAGVRAALPGTDSRWGPWYRLDGRRYGYWIYLTDESEATVFRGRVVANVRFTYGPTAYGIATTVWRVRPPA
jgi:hypothetical protein